MHSNTRRRRWTCLSDRWRARLAIGTQAIISLIALASLSQAQQPAPHASGSDVRAFPASINLPTDRDIDSALAEPAYDPLLSSPSKKAAPPDLKSLMRPRFSLATEWEPESEGFGLRSYDLSVRMPTYPVWGPPPPFLSVGYSFTDLLAPAAADLPSELHDFSLGLSWMRPINERWMARMTISGALATDLNNTSSEAWQLRGGLFGIYRPNEQWSFAVGALATGRDDLPVIPGVGAIWEPSRSLKVNLMLPNPRVSWLVQEDARWQHWAYVGAGISGGTWAYDRAGGMADRVSYREFRAVLGWECVRPQAPGSFAPSGPRLGAEIGYAFGREFEFDSGAADISPDGALLVRSVVSF